MDMESALELLLEAALLIWTGAKAAADAAIIRDRAQVNFIAWVLAAGVRTKNKEEICNLGCRSSTQTNGVDGCGGKCDVLHVSARAYPQDIKSSKIA